MRTNNLTSSLNAALAAREYAANPLMLRVKCSPPQKNGEEDSVEVDPNVTLGSFKRMLAQRWELDVHKKIRLIVSGRMLSDDTRTLAQEGIHERSGNVIHAVISNNPNATPATVILPTPATISSTNNTMAPTPAQVVGNTRGLYLLCLPSFVESRRLPLLSRSAVDHLRVLIAPGLQQIFDAYGLNDLNILRTGSVSNIRRDEEEGGDDGIDEADSLLSSVPSAPSSQSISQANSASSRLPPEIVNALLNGQLSTAEVTEEIWLRFERSPQQISEDIQLIYATAASEGDSSSTTRENLITSQINMLLQQVRRSDTSSPANRSELVARYQDVNEGTTRDFLLGVLMGYFLGILIIFCFCDMNISRKQRLGLLCGVLLQLSMTSMYQMNSKEGNTEEGFE